VAYRTCDGSVLSHGVGGQSSNARTSTSRDAIVESRMSAVNWDMDIGNPPVKLLLKSVRGIFEADEGKG